MFQIAHESLRVKIILQSEVEIVECKGTMLLKYTKRNFKIICTLSNHSMCQLHLFTYLVHIILS